MDHNLEDTLNLDGAMGVDFEHSEDTVVNQADISLDASDHEESIPMEYDSIEEQSMLMDTGNEEIIVSDFMGDQFTLQEYASQEEQVSADNTQQQNENVMVTESGDILNLQFEQPISVPASGVIEEEIHYQHKIKPISVQASGVIKEEINVQPKIITVTGSARAVASRGAVAVGGRAPVPRQVAIAPKPHKVLQNMLQTNPSKQFAIAPKPGRSATPVALVASRQTLGQTTKGNTVLTLGKQLVMMGGAAGQKLKLVTSAARVLPQDDQAQLIQNVSTSQAQGNKVTKVIVQGSQSDVNQPAVITKLISMNSTLPAHSRYFTVQRAASQNPKRVVLASPTKAGIKYTSAKKSQLIAIKSPVTTPVTVPAIAPATAVTTQDTTTTKKVVISANPTHNVILKAGPKQGNVTNVSSGSGQKTQLHQINVPGKGIQYIRLVTNPSAGGKAPAGSAATAARPAPRPVVMPPGKTFVLSDGKGNLIQMTAEKVMSSQPPPLLVTGTVSTSKVSSKPPHKLVRLAPVSSKIGQAAMSRGGQSLLAPLSPAPSSPQPTRVAEDPELMEEQLPYDQLAQLTPTCQPEPHEHHEQRTDETLIVHDEEPDSKSALRALIADTVGTDDSANEDEARSFGTNEVEVDFARRPSTEFSDSNSNGARASGDHPLIVIPPYMKQDAAVPDNPNYERRLSGMINVEVDVGGPYDSFERQYDDTDMVPTELGMRPRKACNCTKSQCLKLYCDCFANGEFCNSCNCNNCHNNLENEELRQKAIRGCLDRNPNAFRPKIGKTRGGGPEHFRRHNKGCNCKRSGCLKNYCECYEAKIACTNICKCVGCRNVEESLERTRRREKIPRPPLLGTLPPPRNSGPLPSGKQPCSFMTTEVIEAVCQCLLAAAVDSGAEKEDELERDPISDVIDEFARCLQDIISASHQSNPRALFDETQA